MEVKIEDLIKTYKEMGFSEGQIEEIRKGLKAGLDVSWYAKPKFNVEQMQEII